MLDPNARTLLLENLRPPDGGKLDIAVGTTFSLDLLALLTAPLAFTWFSWEDKEGRPSGDPNALLEAIRRHADHIHIFCQAGQIKVPANGKQLFAWLESCVHEVLPPNSNGVFHPKVWVLRYLMPDASYRVRVLCLSRNLTFDRSWDTMLALEGVPQTSKQPANEPLAEFIRQLPMLGLHAVDKGLRDTINELAEDVLRTEFELPPGFDNLQFWPLGLGQTNWPFPKQADRLLAISPFVAAAHLRQLAKITNERTLVSRSDTLASLSATELDGYDCFAFTDDADIDTDSETDSVDEEVDKTADSGPLAESLAGLHAKLLVADVGDTTHVYTGSANSTSAAFNTNVEFVVELAGPKSHCGVQRMMEPGGKGVVTFADLLDSFVPGDPLEATEDKALEKLLRKIQMALVHARPVGKVSRLEDANESYLLQLSWTETPAIQLQADEVVTLWPINLSSDAAQSVGIAESKQPWATWSGLSFPALTSFFVFCISVGKGPQRATTAFVMNVPLAGLPPDRNHRVLANLFSDKQQVLRFLLLLLAGEGVVSVGGDGILSGPGLPSIVGGGGFQAQLPMLEALLRALDKDPDKLDQLAGFLDQLRQGETDQSLLPDDFEQIWKPLWEARQQLKAAEN